MEYTAEQMTVERFLSLTDDELRELGFEDKEIRKLIKARVSIVTVFHVKSLTSLD